MARKLHRLRTEAEYKATYRQLKPYLRFNYDLRKTLTPGQKSAITRARNAAAAAGLNSNSQARIIKPPRLPKESKAGYQRRLKSIKRNAGQSGSPLQGVVLALPGNAKRVRFKGGEIIIEGKGYVEKSYPIDPVAFAKDPAGEAELIAETAKLDGMDEIIPIFGNVNRGPSFELPPRFPPDEDDEVYNEFLDFVSDIGALYGSTAALTGFVGLGFVG